MDPSRFPQHQQHNRRYVPPPPLSPPTHHRHPLPPPPHHHRRLSPPPQHHHFYEPQLPPPPPLLPSLSSYLPLPPPPPYNPHSSQFTFRNPNPNPQFLDPRQRFDFSDSDCWDSSPRVLPENNQSVRAYPNAESGYFAFDRKPVSPYRVLDQFVTDSEGSSRFRDRISDGNASKRKEEHSWDSANDADYRSDSRFVLNNDKVSGFGNFEVSDSKYSTRREVDENLGFKSRYGSNFDDELFRYERKDGVSVHDRLGCSRQPMRNLPDSSFNIGNDEFREGDEARVSSGLRVTSFDRKGNRDGTREHRRTPRKQIQKKSALLRIQMGKPNPRNKYAVQLQSSGYYDVSNSSTFRGKGSIIQSNFRTEEEEREREGSPVELDVSFKSNLLVAKPVVTPPRPAISFCMNSTPNSNRKISKLTDTNNSSAEKGLTQPIENMALASSHVGKSVFHENTTTGGSLVALNAVKDKIMDGNLNLEQPSMDTVSIVKDTANMFSACSLGFENQQNENATSAVGITDQQNVNTVMKNIREEADVHNTGEQVMINGETILCTIPFELQTSDLNETFCSSNMKCDSPFEVNEDIPSMPSAPLSPYGDGDSITNVTGQGMDITYDMSIMSGEPKFSPKLPIDQISNEMVSGYDKKSDQEKSVINADSEHVAKIDHLYTTKAVTLPSQNSKIKTNYQNPPNIEANKMKKQLSYAVPKMVPGRSSVFFTNSGKIASSVQNTKPSTWSRTNTDVPSLQLSQSSKKIGKAQTSYIRKGNSLLRKPPLATALPRGSQGLVTSVYRLSPPGIGELKKSLGSDGRTGMPDPSNSSGKRGVNAASQKAQPIKIPHSTSDPKLVEDTRSTEDAHKYIGVSETKSGPVRCLDNQRKDFDNSVSSNTSNIIYMKHKSNQLVASTSSGSLSVKKAELTHVSSSGGYYKRKKNQLIRTAHEGPVNERIGDSVDSPNSKCQKTRKATFSRNFIKRWSNKGTCIPSESSLVWTLRGARSSKEIDNSMQHQRILPHLFPWKRTCWKKVKPNSANILNYSTSSVISKNLLLLRNRGAVYTRSSHGFSLRKSKVLSVGGRSLKWSVSIGKRSKKANEEATLAVAEAQRKKREANGAARVLHGAKIKKYSSSKSVLGITLRPGERIYRIGSVRYKMDASKMTLQRILDDTSIAAALQDKDVKKSYVPMRLVIGNEEYVRIGNGNQLIRDPKKRTRTLASEKVRWSLHTARQRLAKKRKYCQFFTRFGKCNKENGKCPYIHDLSKVAVCTKFLKCLCSNDNCKLTHKVIPERMQDCSYFTQGLCSNKNCPYRHVNVNPNSSTCEAFLRGYCADGNECRKKHSYVCPIFEASGLCPEGSKCKLHHPKKRSEKKKKKKRRLIDQSGIGRYFGSPQMDVSEQGVVLDKHSTKNKDDLLLADFISLDVSDEEISENMDFEMSFDDGYAQDVQVDDDLDEMVKPVRLMNCLPD